jgi:CheY-like chemotaxis protein
MPPRTLRQWKQVLSEKPKEESITMTIRQKGNLKGTGKEINIVAPEILRGRLIETLDRFAFMALCRVAENCQEAVNTIAEILTTHPSKPATPLEDVTLGDLQARLTYKRILVVDDDPTVRASCIRIFSRHDFQVEVAASAKEGLKRTLCGYFDCALIDLKMPDMDGMEIVRTVRKNRSNMAILIITGYGTDESAREATQLGVADYLHKPFTPDELVSAVGHALKTSD